MQQPHQSGVQQAVVAEQQNESQRDDDGRQDERNGRQRLEQRFAGKIEFRDEIRARHADQQRQERAETRLFDGKEHDALMIWLFDRRRKVTQGEMAGRLDESLLQHGQKREIEKQREKQHWKQGERGENRQRDGLCGFSGHGVLREDCNFIRTYAPHPNPPLKSGEGDNRKRVPLP